MTTARLLADHARDLAALHDRVTASQADLAQRQLALADAQDQLRDRLRELREREARLARNDYDRIAREARAALDDDDEPPHGHAIAPARLREARELAARIIAAGRRRRAEIPDPGRQPKTRAEIVASLIIECGRRARGEIE